MDGWYSPLLNDALTAGLCMSMTFGLLGLFVVLRRVVFIGMTMAQVASAGTAFSFLVSAWAFGVFGARWEHWGDILCSLLFTALAVVFISGGMNSRRIPADAVVAFAFSAAWAMGILFVANSSHGIAEVRNLVQGDLLLVCPWHLLIIVAVTLVVYATVLLTWRQQVLMTFDPVMARALGFRSGRWELLFYGLLGLAVVAGIRFAGLLLIVTYLVVPPVLGLVLSSSMSGAALVSVCSAVLATVAGLLAGFHWDLPASPLIAMFSASITILSITMVKLFRSR